jgi:hypothetical protein
MARVSADRDREMLFCDVEPASGVLPLAPPQITRISAASTGIEIRDLTEFSFIGQPENASGLGTIGINANSVHGRHVHRKRFPAGVERFCRSATRQDYIGQRLESGKTFRLCSS